MNCGYFMMSWNNYTEFYTQTKIQHKKLCSTNELDRIFITGKEPTPGSHTTQAIAHTVPTRT